MSAATDRENRISRLMDVESYLTYQQLADRLNVSVVTVRRDVAKLARTNGVQQAKGGVVSVNRFHLDVRLRRNVSEKKRLAAVVRSVVKPGQSLFVDGGTTTFYCLQALRDTPRLTTISYDTQFAPVLKQLPESKNYLAGGLLGHEIGTVLGEFTAEFLRRFSADVALVSCAAACPDGRLLCGECDEVALKGIMLSHAKTKILVADSSKFSREALLTFGTLDDIDTLVTDAMPNASIRRACERKHVEILVPPTDQDGELAHGSSKGA